MNKCIHRTSAYSRITGEWGMSESQYENSLNRSYSKTFFFLHYWGLRSESLYSGSLSLDPCSHSFLL
jgi:lipocalin